jgi:hypothetical protein
LGQLFDVSRTVASKVFITWIKILKEVTAPLRGWPSKQDVQATIPAVLRRDYPNTRTIIDCAEFYIQRPQNATAQSQTYSQYKSHNTVKVLFAISPTGAFIFASNFYGGNASDRFIVEHSGFLDHVEAGDDVMADRGFKIRDLLVKKGATLNMPPFTRKCSYGKGKRLNNNEIWQTRTIAKHRIHVERAIQRLKLFKLMHSMPSSMQFVMDDCIQLIMSLCNLQPPLVKQ